MEYSFFIVAAALLYSRKIYWGYFAFNILFVITVHILQNHNILPEAPPVSRSVVLLVMIAIFIIIMVMLDNAVQLLESNININEKKTIELQEKEEYTRSILNSVTDIIIVLDSRGKIRQMNSAAESYIKNLNETEKGSDFSDLFQLFNLDGSSYILPSAVQKSVKRISLILGEEAAQIPVTLSRNLMIKGDDIDGIVITIRDMSTEKQLEEQLLQSQKLEAIAQLSSGVAHDFNNMLGGIMGAAELLEESSKGTNLELVRMIQIAGDRAAKLTRQLLDFSRKGGMVSTSINIHEILQDSMVMLEQILDKAISVEVDLQAELFQIVGDDTQILNSFVNMAINAAHAMPDGGNLEFHTSNCYFSEDFCETQTDEIFPGNYLQLDVIDTGIGIPSDILDKIFDPFFTTRE